MLPAVPAAHEDPMQRCGDQFAGLAGYEILARVQGDDGGECMAPGGHRALGSGEPSPRLRSMPVYGPSRRRPRKGGSCSMSAAARTTSPSNYAWPVPAWPPPSSTSRRSPASRPARPPPGFPGRTLIFDCSGQVPPTESRAPGIPGSPAAYAPVMDPCGTEPTDALLRRLPGTFLPDPSARRSLRLATT